MTELSAGVRALVGRMESNPEEFFDDAHKWRFMFGDKFREVMTEPEKGALHEALKAVRRKEFDYSVVQTLLKDEMQDQMKGYAQGVISQGVITASSYDSRVAAISNQTIPKQSETRYNFP